MQTGTCLLTPVEGDAVASCSDDGTVVLSSFDGATVEKISPRRSDGSAREVTFSLSAMTLISPLPSVLSPIHALSVQSSGRHMAFGGSSRKVLVVFLPPETLKLNEILSAQLYIWDLKTATMHKTFSGHSDTITAVAFRYRRSASGTHLKVV